MYVQNSYIFNPLEVLEEMELRNVDPNRVRNFEIRIFSTLNYWRVSNSEWIWQFWVWFFFFQATLLLLMQGFAEKGDVEGTLWVHSSVRNMLELSTSAIGDIYKFIQCLRFLRQRTIYTHIKAVMITWIFKNVICHLCFIVMWSNFFYFFLQ